VFLLRFQPEVTRIDFEEALATSMGWSIGLSPLRSLALLSSILFIISFPTLDEDRAP